MWLKTFDDEIVNLDHAYRIRIAYTKGAFDVYADFIVPVGYDGEFDTVSTILAPLSNRDDAEKYIADIAQKLNAEEI